MLMAVKENRRFARGKDRRFYNILPAMKYIVKRVWYVIIKLLVCVGWGVSDLMPYFQCSTTNNSIQCRFFLSINKNTLLSSYTQFESGYREVSIMSIIIFDFVTRS